MFAFHFLFNWDRISIWCYKLWIVLCYSRKHFTGTKESNMEVDGGHDIKFPALRCISTYPLPPTDNQQLFSLSKRKCKFVKLCSTLHARQAVLWEDRIHSFGFKNCAFKDLQFLQQIKKSAMPSTMNCHSENAAYPTQLPSQHDRPLKLNRGQACFWSPDSPCNTYKLF